MKPTRPYECVCIVQIVEKCPITVRGLSPSCLLGFQAGMDIKTHAHCQPRFCQTMYVFNSHKAPSQVGTNLCILQTAWMMSTLQESGTGGKEGKRHRWEA